MKDLAVNLHQLFPFIIFFVVFPLIFYFNYRSQKKQKETFKAVGLKLGLQFSDSPGYQQLRIRMQSDPEFKARHGQANVPKPGYENILKKVLSVMTPPALTGKYNGSEVRITLVRRDKTSYTEFKVVFGQALGMGLRITAKNHFISKYILRFRGQETDLTHEAFDQKLQVQANDPMKLKYLLTFERQRMLLDLFSENPSAVVNDEGIVISRRGFLGDYLQYRTILDKMTAISADINRG